MSDIKHQKGFTLLELVVVVAILAVLLLGVAFLLKPGQMVARARDATRVSDLDALTDAIDFASVDGPEIELGGADPDGSNTNTCSGESSQTVYVSVPDSEAAPSDLPSGWSYGQVTEANLQNVDGTGWLPVDMTGGSSAPPISALPIDPDNTFANGFYYMYVCDRSGGFELTGRMASDERRTGGDGDLQTSDGGNDIFAYETGTDLSLSPTDPIAFWSFGDSTSGAITNNQTVGLEDVSGTGHNGTAKNTNGTGMQFASGVNAGDVDFDGVDDYVATGWGNDYFPLPLLSICVWAKSPGLGSGMTSGGIFNITYGLTFNLDNIGRFYTTMDDGAAAPVLMVADNLFDDEWHHLCMTFDGTDRYMYVDGSEEASAPTTWLGTTRWPTNGSTIGLNINNGAVTRFNGEIDDVTLYDRALSAADVSYLYDAFEPL